MTDIASLHFNGTTLIPSSPEYASAIDRTSHLAIRHPAFIAFPETFDDVPKLIQFARSNNLELAVKGGGANMSSSAVASTEGGLVIDLVKLNKVQVSDDRNSVTVGGGAKWGEVYGALSKLGLDTVGGSNGHVGVGGYLTCGGWSYLNGKYGMGCDGIIEATVALSDGTIVKASSESNPDLFMAIRGGMGHFGIVLEFVLRVYPTLGPINTGIMVVAGDRFEETIPALQQVLRNMGDCDRLAVNFLRDAQSGTFHPGIAFIPTIPGSPEHAEQILKPLKEIVGYTMMTAVPDQISWAKTSDAVFATLPRRLHTTGAQLQDMQNKNPFDVELYKNLWTRWLKWTEENDFGKESFVMYEFCRAGKAKEEPSGETALNKRDSTCLVGLVGCTRSPEFDKQVENWARELCNIARAARPNGGVLAGAMSGDETVEEVFGAEMAKKLRAIKAKYDPGNVWKKGYKF